MWHCLVFSLSKSAKVTWDPESCKTFYLWLSKVNKNGCSSWCSASSHQMMCNRKNSQLCWGARKYGQLLNVSLSITIFTPLHSSDNYSCFSDFYSFPYLRCPAKKKINKNVLTFNVINWTNKLSVIGKYVLFVFCNVGHLLVVKYFCWVASTVLEPQCGWLQRKKQPSSVSIVYGPWSTYNMQ